MIWRCDVVFMFWLIKGNHFEWGKNMQFSWFQKPESPPLPSPPPPPPPAQELEEDDIYDVGYSEKVWYNLFQ